MKKINYSSSNKLKLSRYTVCLKDLYFFLRVWVWHTRTEPAAKLRIDHIKEHGGKITWSNSSFFYMWQGGRGRTVTWHVTGTNLPPRPHGFCTYKITPLLLQWSWYTDRTLGVDWWIEYLLGTERYLLYHSWPVSSSVSFKISSKRWSIEITFFTQRGGGCGVGEKIISFKALVPSRRVPPFSC